MKKNTIVAEEIVLVDEKGNRRAMLGTVSGISGLMLWGANDQPRLHLGVDRDESVSIGLMHNDGKVGLTLTLDSEGGCGIALADSGGNVRCILCLEPGTGNPSLGMSSKTGLPAIAVSVLDKRNAIAVYGQHGNVVQEIS